MGQNKLRSKTTYLSQPSFTLAEHLLLMARGLVPKMGRNWSFLLRSRSLERPKNCCHQNCKKATRLTVFRPEKKLDGENVSFGGRQKECQCRRSFHCGQIWCLKWKMWLFRFCPGKCNYSLRIYFSRIWIRNIAHQIYMVSMFKMQILVQG